MRLQTTANQCSMVTRLTLSLVTLSAIACSTTHPTPSRPMARAFTDAEVLFHRDLRWLGADAALSVPLGNGRTVWLFGDTFIAKSNAHMRSESEMARNTVAIQTGKDPRTASITFHWRQDSTGWPASFFPERGQRWYWPGHGIKLDEGPLVIFLYAIVATPGQGLGFASAGYTVAVIDNPDASAETWNPRVGDIASSTFDAVPATAVVQDGAYIVAVAIRQEGTHAGALVRYPTVLLAQGDTDHAEWWEGDGRGWVPESSLGAGGVRLV